MTKSCIQQEKNRVMRYHTTVQFFAIFAKVLQERSIQVRVEPKCKQNNSNDCYPDFHCRVKGTEFTAIFEHKGSVSNDEKFIAKEIHDTTRYCDLKVNDAVAEVILLFPEMEMSKTKAVLKKIDVPIAIWGFDFSYDKSRLAFKQHYGDVKGIPYKQLLDSPIPFLNTWGSFIRFLRDEPPVVYTASFLWNTVLKSFMDAWREPSEAFDIDFQSFLAQVQKWYPASKEANQITSKIVKEALVFLHDIEWVEYPNSKGEITVKGTKRLRERIVSDRLCKEFCERYVGAQSKLIDF